MNRSEVQDHVFSVVKQNKPFTIASIAQVLAPGCPTIHGMVRDDVRWYISQGWLEVCGVDVGRILYHVPHGRDISFVKERKQCLLKYAKARPHWQALCPEVLIPPVKVAAVEPPVEQWVTIMELTGDFPVRLMSLGKSCKVVGLDVDRLYGDAEEAFMMFQILVTEALKKMKKMLTH